MSISIKKDDYVATFDNQGHDEFMEALKEWGKETRFVEVPAKDIYFSPLSSLDPDDVLGGQEVYDDSQRVDALPIVANLPTGEKVALRPYIYKDVKQHHRDNAAVLGDMLRAGSYESWCEHINLGRGFLKKTLLVMVRGCKASGWSSEFNCNRSELEQVNFIEESLSQRFPNVKFLSGEISHYFTMVKFKLDDSIQTFNTAAALAPNVVSAYEGAWVSGGGDLDELRAAVPIATFITGESGLTAITLGVGLLFPNETFVPLGKSLSVTHRGSDEKVWGRFEVMPDNIAVLYQKGLTGISDLAKRLIRHPYSCATHVAQLFQGICSADALEEFLEDFEIIYPPEDTSLTCQAIHIFNGVNDMLRQEGPKQSAIKRLRCTEVLAQLVTMNWNDLDAAIPASVGKRKSAATKSGDNFDLNWFSDTL